MTVTPVRIAVAIAVLIAVLLGAVLVTMQLKGSPNDPLYLTIVPYQSDAADAATTVDPDVPEPEPPTSGVAVGYAGYSVNPRAQTTDLAIVAHHVAVPVDWTVGEPTETVFRWPAADDDWTGTVGYRWLAFPVPPGHPDEPAGFETQHAVSVAGVQYRVLISQEALTIAAELMTLNWSTVGE